MFLQPLRQRVLVHFRDIHPDHDRDLARAELDCSEDDLVDTCVELVDDGLLEYDSDLASWHEAGIGG